MSRLNPIERGGGLAHDDRVVPSPSRSGTSLTTAQDMENTAKQRAAQMHAEAMEAWMDETGAHVDALCLGWKLVNAGQVHGGIKPLTMGRGKK